MRVISTPRDGARPETSDEGPHRQLTQKATPELWGRLVDDTSIHLCLPADRSFELTRRGWTEPHQYEEFGTEFMIYGPRTPQELETVLSVIEESIAFARQPQPS